MQALPPNTPQASVSHIFSFSDLCQHDSVEPAICSSLCHPCRAATLAPALPNRRLHVQPHASTSQPTSLSFHHVLATGISLSSTSHCHMTSHLLLSCAACKGSAHAGPVQAHFHLSRLWPTMVIRCTPQSAHVPIARRLLCPQMAALPVMVGQMQQMWMDLRKASRLPRDDQHVCTPQRRQSQALCGGIRARVIGCRLPSLCPSWVVS